MPIQETHRRAGLGNAGRRDFFIHLVVYVLVGTMLVGTIAISFLGAIAAALTLQARRGGMLVAILVLPLYVPTLIYGVTTISIALTPPGSPWPSFLLLCAISLGSLVIGPWATALALRHQMQ